MTTVAPVKEEKKTLEQLEEERRQLLIVLEEYLLVVGVEYSMLDAVIQDLKDQMYLHADQNINNMIADLINLENKILYAKEEAMLNSQKQPQ